MINVGDNIFICRCRLKLSQHELSEKLDISKTTLQKYENNSVDALKYSTMLKMCEIFNITVAELLTTKL